MPLTDTQVRNARYNPDGTGNRLSDGGRMYFQLDKSGAKCWRMNYRFAGKDKTLALGVYPDVSLAAARKKREEAREKLAAGFDPSNVKRLEKRAARLAAANSFEAVARGCMAERKGTVEPAQHAKTLARMENDVFPWLGKRPITEIDAPEILAVLKRIDSRGARFTAHRVRSEISRVFRYGIKEGHCKADPARDLVGAIPPAQTNHFASITEPIDGVRPPKNRDEHNSTRSAPPRSASMASSSEPQHASSRTFDNGPPYSGDQNTLWSDLRMIASLARCDGKLKFKTTPVTRSLMLRFAS
jgi:hypothetical protein